MDKIFNEENASKKIRRCLTYLGFNYSNIGTIYFQEVLEMFLADPKLIHSMTNSIFAMLASKYNIANVRNIERDIRTAIKRAYDQGLLKTISCFSNTRPQIKQLACYLFDYFTEFSYAI